MLCITDKHVVLSVFIYVACHWPHLDHVTFLQVWRGKAIFSGLALYNRNVPSFQNYCWSCWYQGQVCFSWSFAQGSNAIPEIKSVFKVTFNTSLSFEIKKCNTYLEIVLNFDTIES